jgi:hypothetical protein
METREYTKVINGKLIKKIGSEIVIDSRIFFPTHEMIIEDGWVLYEEPTKDEHELLLDAINSKLQEIKLYDNSSKVNVCYIKYNGNIIPYWADKSERNSLKPAIQDYKSMGNDTYRLDLRDLGVSLTLPCDMLLHMLSALEVYAINCYNTTSDHMFTVKTLTSVEEVESYDYTLNYPEKITFEL